MDIRVSTSLSIFGLKLSKLDHCWLPDIEIIDINQPLPVPQESLIILIEDAI